MNAFNRLVLIAIALLALVIPALMLLVAFGVVPADTLNSYTGYRNGLGWLGQVAGTSPNTQARVLIGVGGALVAIVSLVLLLRELILRLSLAPRRAMLEVEPAQQTVVSSSTVRSLAEGAAREAGAKAPSASLAATDGRYRVICRVAPAPSGSFTEYAVAIRHNVERVLGEQKVPFEEVRVVIDRAASSSKERR